MPGKAIVDVESAEGPWKGTPAAYVFQLLNAAGAPVAQAQTFPVSALPATVTFLAVPDGVGYTAIGITRDAASVELARVTSKPFNVPAPVPPPLTMKIVGQLTVTVVPA